MFRYALLPIALAQFIAPALPGLFGIGQSLGDAARGDYGGQPPEQPLGIAFSIWGVIFTAYLVFAIHALLRDDALTRRVGPPLAWAGVFNVVWMLVAQGLDVQLLNFVLLFPIIWFAWSAARAFDGLRGMGGSAMKLVTDAATGLLSGWITVAVAISTPLSIRTLTGLGATDAPWRMLIVTLAVAALAAFIFASRISRSLWYFVALGWGVFWVAANNLAVTGMTTLAIGAFFAGAAIVTLRLTRGANGSIAAT